MFRPIMTYQRVVDALLAGGFLLVAMAWEMVVVFGGGFLRPVVIVLGLSAALLFRRWAPGLALILAWITCLAQMAMQADPMFTNIAVFGVLYATAAYGSRLVFWLGFASSFIGAALITAYVIVRGTFIVSRVTPWLEISALFVFALLALLMSWTVGLLMRTFLRARDNQRGRELAQAETAAEQHRSQIARDMHDVVAHSLAVVIAQADGARYAAATDPAAAGQALATISSTARGALADVRLLLTQLRHRQAEGPQPTLTDLEALYAQVRAAGVPLRVDVDPTPPGEPPGAIQLAVYRILQEALTNALRHGDGGPVDVHLSWYADHVDISVQNGSERGTAPGGSHGYGLIGMRERAQLVGGTLDAGADGARFVVRARLPIEAGPDAA